MAISTVTRPTRRFAVAGLLFASISLLAACLTPEQDTVLRELNNDRTANGRTALVTHFQAQSKAQAWAEKLAREGTLYHSNLSSGITVGWCNLGENVGYGSSAASIQDAYMASPGHKANVLNTIWNGVGVGYAKGKVNGAWVVFTVQVFIRTC